jgi:beta-glucosidase
MKKLGIFVALLLGLSVLVNAEDKKSAEPFGMKSSTTATPRYNPDAPKKGHWHQRWDARRKQIAKGGIEIVLVGDSITHLWESDPLKNPKKIGGKATYKKYFGKYNVMNLGFSGDRTEHTLWMTSDSKLLDNIDPKLVVVMIGTNNIGHRKAGVEATAAGIELIIKNIRTKLPNAKILLFGIFPRSARATHPNRAKLKEINNIICKLADNKSVFYCDITDKFLDKDGNLSKNIMPDHLHPNEAGYEIWAQAIMPYVEKFVGKK